MSKPKKEGIKESLIEDLILRWLNAQPGCFAFKMDVQARYDPRLKCYRKLNKWIPRGGSDVICYMPHSAGVFEIKRPEEYQAFFKSPGPHELRQQGFMERVRATGHFAECVCSLQQVMELYKKLTDFVP